MNGMLKDDDVYEGRLRKYLMSLAWRNLLNLDALSNALDHQRNSPPALVCKSTQTNPSPKMDLKPEDLDSYFSV